MLTTSIHGLPAIPVEQAAAFRLRRHHLSARLPVAGVLAAVAACGIQDTPAGSAALALAARVDGLTPAHLEQARWEDKSLLLIWSLHSVPLLIPTSDLPVFTTGLRPADEASRLAFVVGATDHLSRFGLTATGMLERVRPRLRQALDGRELTKDELGAAIADALAADMPAERRSDWAAPDGMTRYGESLVRYVLPLAALHGDFCLGRGQGQAATFQRLDQWLGGPLPTMEDGEARQELLRRFLRCHGPATARHFATWAGISPEQAQPTWDRLAPELTPVTLNGHTAWVLTADLAELQAAAPPTGIRMLPPHDPYLNTPDRETLVPDPALHQRIWRTTGNPGVVLVDGRIVALWRHHRVAKRLRVDVELVEPIRPAVRDALFHEADGLAPFRGCESATVTLRG